MRDHIKKQREISVSQLDVMQAATVPDTVTAATCTFHISILEKALADRYLPVETGEQESGLSVFIRMRPRLFGIAYRMLGSAAEAEDIVQDVWLRWQSTNRRAVENPPAYLATMATRLCINLAQSAHTRRETYIGTWLPEPVDADGDSGLGAERGEALKLAVLLLLEKLSPTERCAFVLREAFDYSYRQIADILQMEEANVRQLVSRARKHIADGRRTPVSSGEQRRLLEAFIAAARKGDLAALEGLFAEDVVSRSDGGRGDPQDLIDALRRGITRPSKLAAIARSGLRSGDSKAAGSAVA